MQIGPPPCTLPSKPRQGAGEGSHALGPGSAAPAGGRGRHSPQPRRPPGRRKRQAAQEAAEAVRPVRWPAAASPRGPVGMRTPGQTQGPVLAQPAAPVSPSERLEALHPAPSTPVLQPRASPTHHGGTARAALPFSPCVQACPAPSTGGQIWCLLPVHRSVCFLCGLGGLSPLGVVVSAPGQALAPGWASGQPERGRQAGEAPGPASPPRPPSGPQPPCFVPTLRVDALNDLVWLSACVPASPPEAECP